MLLLNLRGPRQLLADRQPVPESVDTASGAVRGMGPLGFSGALLPYLKALGDTDALATQVGARAGRRWRHLDDTARNARSRAVALLRAVLLVFGQAWLDGRYEFGRNGQLQPSWRTLCRPNRPA
jgi:endo-1,4-beta-D-glucanase Y